jgi:hypothetical protein
MKKFLAAVAALVAYPLATWIVAHASDAFLLRQLGRVKSVVAWRKPGDQLVVVLGDLMKIFVDAESSRLARRLILEARPAQFRAVVRGAIR